jgi:hypothetical protein
MQVHTSHHVSSLPGVHAIDVKMTHIRPLEQGLIVSSHHLRELSPQDGSLMMIDVPKMLEISTFYNHRHDYQKGKSNKYCMCS